MPLLLAVPSLWSRCDGCGHGTVLCISSLLENRGRVGMLLYWVQAVWMRSSKADMRKGGFHFNFSSQLEGQCQVSICTLKKIVPHLLSEYHTGKDSHGFVVYWS